MDAGDLKMVAGVARILPRVGAVLAAV